MDPGNVPLYVCFGIGMGATFIAAVERATGRRVTSFLSKMNLNPHFVVEIFRLGPETGAEAF